MGIIAVSRPSHRFLTVVSAIFVFALLLGVYLAPCFIEHDYFNDTLDKWHIISVGETSSEVSASYQVALSGDYLGTGEIVTITNYHHGHPGIFIHRNANGSWTLNYGDLVVFLNQGGSLSSTEVFGFDEGQYKLLFNNLEMSWGLVAQQLDDDADSEITMCCGTPLPYWCPVTPGAKYAYGLDVIDLFSGMI